MGRPDVRAATGLLLGTVGLATLCLAGVLVWVPWLLEPLVSPGTVDALAGRLAAVVLGGCSLVASALAARAAPSGRDAARPVQSRGEPVADAEATAVERFDRRLRAVVEAEDGDDARPDRGEDRDAVRAEVERVAASTVAAADRVSTAEARERVRSGAWTDDPVAAAALADDGVLPLRWRLYRLVFPGLAYRRIVERTVAAIEARGGERP